jgi:hypothetical protein
MGRRLIGDHARTSVDYRPFSTPDDSWQDAISVDSADKASQGEVEEYHEIEDLFPRDDHPGGGSSGDGSSGNHPAGRGPVGGGPSNYSTSGYGASIRELSRGSMPGEDVLRSKQERSETGIDGTSREMRQASNDVPQDKVSGEDVPMDISSTETSSAESSPKEHLDAGLPRGGFRRSRNPRTQSRPSDRDASPQHGSSQEISEEESSSEETSSEETSSEESEASMPDEDVLQQNNDPVQEQRSEEDSSESLSQEAEPFVEGPTFSVIARRKSRSRVNYRV